jgi:Spy/CpxP family protein refolding chaperone
MMVTAKRARVMGLLMLAIIFAVGAMTGAATMRVATGDKAEPRETAESRERRPSLWEALDLTPEQRAEVDGIMERRREEVESFWNEHGPQLRAVMDSARADVREVLTPEQQVMEAEFFAERRKHYRGTDHR